MPFNHHDLLDIERLSVDDISIILEHAKKYAGQNRSALKKTAELRGKTVINLFFEPSTRTRTSFEIAAKRLSADVINIPVEHSSTKKGETLLDTVLTLDAMQIDALVIRHAEDGVPQFVAPHIKASIINAGDGKHEHPTQALLDALTIQRHKNKLNDIVVAICGDVSHSRVARSNIHLLTKFGAKVRTVSPTYFAANNYGNLGVENFVSMEKGLKGADVVMVLRIQKERMAENEFAISLKDYRENFIVDHKRLAVAKPDVIVMNPGPIPRDMEISSELADDPKISVMREQVELGVAVRMAVLDLLINH